MGVEVLGWVATTFSLIGVVLNARKSIWCWFVWCLANTLWTDIAIVRHDWPQVLLWVVFTVANVYGWWEWRK